MPFIKKLVTRGFKSFARETEVPLINGMNVIVGPNGSGKSNITDAICFVLGRLSMKSMRATKTTSLIFAGNKSFKPLHEAAVKLVFDNTDRKIPIDNNELSIERIVRRNGQSIYKINDEVKTRQEVLELMASAGIDPYGFNIVLQGEIYSMVRSQPEERRKILEDVAGISIYESRKEKSMHELEKTDEKLKEVAAILRERKAYLRNLEEERKQALRYKELEENVKKLKASIFNKKIEEKKKELKKLEEDLLKNQASKEKIKHEADKIQNEIETTEAEITNINRYMQKSSGIEQERLGDEISNLKANLAGLHVRKEGTETRLKEVLARRLRAESDIKLLDKDISDLRKNSPMQAQKHKELEEKRKQLADIEKEKKELYNLKERLNSIKALISEKERRIQKVKNESDFIIKESERLGQEITFSSMESCQKSIEEMRKELEILGKSIEKNELERTDHEKILSVSDSEIANLEKIKKQVKDIDICPLCKSQITPDHIGKVSIECDEKIKEFHKSLKDSQSLLEHIKNDLVKNKVRREILLKDLPKAEISLVKMRNIEEKKHQIKSLFNDEKSLEAEKKELEKNKSALENKFLQTKDIEENYDRILLEIQQVSSRTEQNMDVDLEFKERDLEKTKIILKQTYRDEEDLSIDLKELTSNNEEKHKLLEIKEKEYTELSEKFRKIIEKREGLQKELKENSLRSNEKIILLSNFENLINNLKVERARLDAERESLEVDMQSFKVEEPIQGSFESLQERLEKTQQTLMSIGNVNMRALEAYVSVKEEYDQVEQKATTLEKEKEEILKIVAEIDTKKKRTFMKTLVSINELFNRNFTQLSTKGEAFLDLENKEDPFAGGLNIMIRVAKGKYFDVTGLSGGEQTLVALSLIFAIQEYKPYSFYIFDEVDAALDKRNSEKLAGLVKRYMKTGQYIIVTHNDALITESSVLYGVSMQEGISKILSLQL